MEKRKLQWHPGFCAALRITLESDLEYLEIHEEYLLSKKPLQVDVLIVKKLKDVAIRKSIGEIFRRYNIIEYKSPEDHLSINDFYKVYGYACIYQADTDRVKEVDPEELTITFVCSHYPREMLRHLKAVRGITVEDRGNGIYDLKGDPIPMQLLVTPRLSAEENYWLQNLRTDLKAGTEIRTLMSRYEEHRRAKDYEAVMDLIARANWEQMEVEKKMCDALNELFAEELKEADDKGREKGVNEGREQLLREQIAKKREKGKNVSEIAEELETDEQTVRKLMSQ
ncbi:3-isopropylmalate dehydrogenase [Mediterraneibacter glycyrrhizinilyticus]|nr:3-isopropylmalate dehydrogenase [Mediterraneibacter glycyrrhizinilyticus]MBM6853466.1 3-isopropylmalate dehydrogenase [Mediterraneibacter glycyrrhizinilyticus]